MTKKQIKKKWKILIGLVLWILLECFVFKTYGLILSTSIILIILYVVVKQLATYYRNTVKNSTKQDLTKEYKEEYQKLKDSTDLFDNESNTPE